MIHPKWITLADRWIISRFNRTVAEADDRSEHYRFDQYAKACYDFFWRDFCDWYVEADQARVKDPQPARDKPPTSSPPSSTAHCG